MIERGHHPATLLLPAVLAQEYEEACEVQLMKDTADEREAITLLLSIIAVAAVAGFVCGYLFTHWKWV
jgi:hypothetical protein